MLDVIAWICDGQNEEMQKVLREQDIHLDVGLNTETHWHNILAQAAIDNVYCLCMQSFNIVGQVAILLLGISSKLNPRTMRIAKGALQALIEMCAGNYLNQEAAFKGQVTDSVIRILSYGEMEPPQNGPIPVIIHRTCPLSTHKIKCTHMHTYACSLTHISLSTSAFTNLHQGADINYRRKLLV